MSRSHAMVTIIIIMWIGLPASLQAQGVVEPGEVATVERIGWLAGCWEMSAPGITFEEHWMAPRGGTMVGMSRTVRGDATIGYEHLLISRRDSVLVYQADPSGQSLTEFRSTAVEHDLATFENPQHDYPRRITYRHISPDSLVAEIDDGVGGNRRQFRFRRVACGG